jgi:hypothetical protein
MSDLDRHEAECALRFKSIEDRLERGGSRMVRLEALIWAMYPFMLGAVFLSKDL